VGSTQTREAAVVDAAWDIDAILRLAAEDDMKITHALVTHTHPDHVGGRFAGVQIAGLAEILGQARLKVVIHKAEAGSLKFLSSSDLMKVDSGDESTLAASKSSCFTPPGTPLDPSVFWSRIASFPGTHSLSIPAGALIFRAAIPRTCT
jgi:hypothetical protein